MARFRFSLESVLRLRRYRREQAALLLAQVLAEDQRLAAQQAETESERERQLAELRELADGGPVDVDRSASRRYYAGLLSGALESIARSRAVVAGQLELCRKALVRADQELKLLDRIREKQLAEYEFDQERRASRDREEAWQATHRM